ncbi:unnamed protein product [Prorocentrum cordatum]|uniref:PKD/REJ-like domain-containing protein n=1 Tax=Prorocentrum cordatum TaxID=2364126 RepID=A0ABN9Y1L2_9DINO|nr:unnamed protein product [Polarella glacialis]
MSALSVVLGTEAARDQIANALYIVSTSYNYPATRKLSSGTAAASIAWTVEYAAELYKTVMEAVVVSSSELAANTAALQAELAEQLILVAGLSSDAASSLEIIGFEAVSTLLITKTETSTATTSSLSSTTKLTATSETTATTTSMFVAESFQALGRPTECSFNGDRTIFRAVLGASATVLLGDRVSTRPLTRLGKGAAVSEGFTALVSSAEAAVSVQAALSPLPRAAQPCSGLVFSGTASGTAGRAPGVAWHFGPRTPQEMVPPLLAALRAANASQSLLVRFGAVDFYAAAQAAMQAAGGASSSPLFLELVVEATSWLGSTSSASAAVELLWEAEPLPTLTPDVPTALALGTEAELTLSVSTGFVSPSVCTGVASARPPPVVLSWEICGFRGNLSWIPLGDASGPSDLARSPNVVSFAPFTFASEANYSVRVTAAFEDTPSTVALPEVVFQLRTRPPPPPVAVVSGPTTATSSCAFTLSGSGSYDLGAEPLTSCVYDYSGLGYADCDAAIAELAADGFGVTCAYLQETYHWFCTGCDCAGETTDYQTPVLTYTWSCMAVSDGDGSTDCDAVANLDAANGAALTNGTGASGELLRIEGGVLPPGTYEFSLTVGRATGISGTTVHTVVVGQAGPPPVEITTPWADMDRVSVQVGDFSSATATLQASPGCPVAASWLFAWALASPAWNSSVVATPGPNASNTGGAAREWAVELLLDTQVQEVASTVPATSFDLLATTTADGIRGQLTAGRQYALVLLVLPQALAPGEAPDLSGLGTVSACEARGMFATFSGSFVADGTPAPGIVSASPSSGFSVVTSFAISTLAWTDEEPSSLEYAMYRFPQSELTEAWAMPLIEWDDPLSPAYWSKLGGALLRDFDASPTLTDIILPTGTFFFLVRARDSMGAIGTASLPGVEVAVSEEALTLGDVSSAFDAARASNSPGAVLNTLSAVTAAVASGEDEALRRAAVQESLNALTFVVGIFQPDSSSPCPSSARPSAPWYPLAAAP